MRSLVAIALLAACTDPIIEMELIMPQNADSFDTSCLTAVEVRVAGSEYAQDPSDYTYSCIQLTAGATYASVREAVRGKFELEFPDSGISGVEIYGWAGPTPCKVAAEDDPYVSPDLLFFGHSGYIGQDKLDIPVVPNLGCGRSQVNVRSVDMLALVGGATCQQAGAPELLGQSWMGAGTMIPRMGGKGSRFYGNLEGSDLTAGNMASFMAPTQIGPKACLAIDGGDGMMSGSTGCVFGGPTVCAGAGEIEHAAMPFAISYSTDNADPTIMTKFPGVIYGTVWSNTTPRATVGGATVTVDANHGKVVYVDPPTTAGKLPVRTDQTATGPSGMFILYADTMVAAKVTLPGGANRSVTLAALSEGPAAAMIVVGP